MHEQTNLLASYEFENNREPLNREPFNLIREVVISKCLLMSTTHLKSKG